MRTAENTGSIHQRPSVACRGGPLGPWESTTGEVKKLVSGEQLHKSFVRDFLPASVALVLNNIFLMCYDFTLMKCHGSWLQGPSMKNSMHNGNSA